MSPLPIEADRDNWDQESLYGYPHVDDPRDFFPDRECCSPEELASHAAAVAAWESGQPIPIEPQEYGPWVGPNGQVVLGDRPSPEWRGVCHANQSWGIGVSVWYVPRNNQ
jgi:hypothetical protein